MSRQEELNNYCKALGLVNSAQRLLSMASDELDSYLDQMTRDELIEAEDRVANVRENLEIKLMNKPHTGQVHFFKSVDQARLVCIRVRDRNPELEITIAGVFEGDELGKNRCTTFGTDEDFEEINSWLDQLDESRTITVSY